MKSSDLVQLALNQQKEMSVPELQKRIKALEAQIEAMTVPKEEEPLTKAEEAFMKMTDAEMREWAKTAASSITHITEIGVCVKCNCCTSTQVPSGAVEYRVTCGSCGHSRMKGFFD